MDINEVIHFLQDYIKEHYSDEKFSRNLDKNIIRLSHKICEEHEELGHLKRQSVRTILREKCESEIFKTKINSMINMKQPTITFDKSAGMLILHDFLKLKPICSFCGINITEDNIGGIFPNPTRVCCTNIGCLMEAISEK